MKITIYTVNDCKFSGEEKAYLQSKGMQFEEKNLESNRDFLTEMLQKSNNFAGTPVTEIVKDDGSSIIIKGFTQTEFDAALGGANVETTTPPVQDLTQQAPVETPVSEPMSTQAMPTPTPVVEPIIPQTSEVASAMSIPDPIPPVDQTPIAPPIINDTQPTPNSQPAMPDVSPGQVLSDTISTNPSVTLDPTQSPSVSAFEPQGGPVSDPAVAMPADPMTMPQAPAQPTEQAAQNNPLNSVLNDLQSKANS